MYDPFQQVDAIRAAAVEVMEQAIAHLIAKGVSHQEAQSRVQANFERLNLAAKTPITVQALCQPGRVGTFLCPPHR